VKKNNMGDFQICRYQFLGKS